MAIGRLGLGIGHTTRELPPDRAQAALDIGYPYYRHRPFGWLLDPASGEMRIFDVSGPFLDDYECLDPTSLIARGPRSFELFTTEVERHFHERGSRRQVASYRFDLGQDFVDAASLCFGAELDL